MSGLVLKLRPREQLLVNGVVIENGERKTSLRIKTAGAHILRLRDLISSEKATTPIKRACLFAQRAVAGELSSTEAAAKIKGALSDRRLKNNRRASEIVRRLDRCVDEDNFYVILKELRALVKSDDHQQTTLQSCIEKNVRV